MITDNLYSVSERGRGTIQYRIVCRPRRMSHINSRRMEILKLRAVEIFQVFIIDTSLLIN